MCRRNGAHKGIVNTLSDALNLAFEAERMVEPRGIEPLTSAMPLQRSPS